MSNKKYTPEQLQQLGKRLVSVAQAFQSAFTKLSNLNSELKSLDSALAIDNLSSWFTTGSKEQPSGSVVDPTLKSILKPSMEVVPEFLFETQEVVLSSPAASKFATVVPIEPNYYSDNANCQIVSYGNSGNYIYQLRLEDLGLSEILTGQKSSYFKYSGVPVCRDFWGAYYGT